MQCLELRVQSHGDVQASPFPGHLQLMLDTRMPTGDIGQVPEHAVGE